MLFSHNHNNSLSPSVIVIMMSNFLWPDQSSNFNQHHNVSLNLTTLFCTQAKVYLFILIMTTVSFDDSFFNSLSSIFAPPSLFLFYDYADHQSQFISLKGDVREKHQLTWICRKIPLAAMMNNSLCHLTFSLATLDTCGSCECYGLSLLFYLDNCSS